MFKVPELRKRIFFTLLVIFLYRLGGHVPTPGVDTSVLRNFLDSDSGGLFGLFDMIVGGSFGRFAVFALGIMPYITASIIMQLMGTIFPAIHKLQREGAEGRKKLTQYTRYGTVIFGAIQAIGISIFISTVEGGTAVIPEMRGFLFMFTTVVSLTTGTVLTMWLGEQITARGVGNGISLLIFIGIVAEMPMAIINQVRMILVDRGHIVTALAILGIVLVATVAVVIMTQAMRRIPIQTPKKVVGTKMYAGQNTVLPLRLNMAGVIPIIFASSIMTFPGMIVRSFAGAETSPFLEDLFRVLGPGGIIYSVFFGLLIIFFTYFYTAIVFNPVDIADNLKRQGGFIPGIRPGKKTAEYLENVLTRITLPGSVFLALIAVLPMMLMGPMGGFYFGGTSILIVVGVALDTLQQLESHLQMRNYEGFMKKGTLRGRR
ncbi:MAG: preprotein translocase subunit SecY [Chitinispirillales bacterium]|jgi:preprotein translocase subunit SecY|nr:preprotein translocase subunit SecY [Chitinispirillales bacterium]